MAKLIGEHKLTKGVVLAVERAGTFKVTALLRIGPAPWGLENYALVSGLLMHTLLCIFIENFALKVSQQVVSPKHACTQISSMHHPVENWFPLMTAAVEALNGSKTGSQMTTKPDLLLGSCHLGWNPAHRSLCAKWSVRVYKT